LESLEDWNTGVGFNSTKCKSFHYSSDKNMLWAFSPAAIDEGGKKKAAKPGLLRSPSKSDVMYP